MSISQLCIFKVQTRTLCPGFLDASQVNPIPEKSEYLPARFGYIDTDTSKAYIKIFAGTNLTTMVSVMIFSMTPNVIGPGLIIVSILKFPLFIIATSASLSCLQMETKNSRKGLCCFRIVVKRKSIYFFVKHATFSCLTLNYLYISSIYQFSSMSGSIFSRLWLTVFNSIQKCHFQLLRQTFPFCQVSTRLLLLPQFRWIRRIEKFLKSVPLFTSTLSFIFQWTMRWSWPPKIKSIPLTQFANFISLYFIIWVNAMTISHFSQFLSLQTIRQANSIKGMYSHISLQQGQSVSIHYFSAKLNTPIFTPFFSKIQDSRPSARRRYVRLSQILLSNQGKLVIPANYFTRSISQSRS